MNEAPLLRTGGRSGRGRTGLGVLVACALLAVGAGAWLLGQPAEKSTARVPAGNQPINAGAREPGDLTANNSPTVASNPIDARNLVVSNRIDRPRFSCALHASFDGGLTWAQMTVPFPAGEEDPPRCFAPNVAYATDGTLHMSFVTLKGNGNVPNALWVVSSKDGGRTFDVPVKAAGPLAFQVQLTADTSEPSRLYLSWLQAEATGSLLFPDTGYPIVTSTSIDAGATWSAPVQVSSSSRQRVVAPSPALGPNGELYVLYLDLLDDRLDYGGAHEGRGGDPYEGPWALVLARSVDQARTWEETLVDGQIRPTERFVVFLPPTPSLAVDPRSGQLYVAFTDGRAGDADVNLWTSSDGGRTFGPPRRVNDTPVGDGTAQYLPRLDVAPGGRLDVVYFDRRADLTNVQNEVSLQSSFDRGRTFTRRVRVSDRSFDSRIGPGRERDLPDLGSRLALMSTDRRALAVWPDTRGGSQLTLKQDLASAVVEIPPPTAASRSWLRVVGAVAMLLGLGCLLLALRARRSAVVLIDPSVARQPRPPEAGRPQPTQAPSEPVPAQLRTAVDDPSAPQPPAPWVPAAAAPPVDTHVPTPPLEPALDEPLAPLPSRPRVSEPSPRVGSEAPTPPLEPAGGERLAPEPPRPWAPSAPVEPEGRTPPLEPAVDGSLAIQPPAPWLPEPSSPGAAEGRPPSLGPAVDKPLTPQPPAPRAREPSSSVGSEAPPQLAEPAVDVPVAPQPPAPWTAEPSLSVAAEASPQLAEPAVDVPVAPQPPARWGPPPSPPLAPKVPTSLGQPAVDEPTVAQDPASWAPEPPPAAVTRASPPPPGGPTSPRPPDPWGSGSPLPPASGEPLPLPPEPPVPDGPPPPPTRGHPTIWPPRSGEEVAAPIHPSADDHPPAPSIPEAPPPGTAAAWMREPPPEAGSPPPSTERAPVPVSPSPPPVQPAPSGATGERPGDSRPGGEDS